MLPEAVVRCDVNPVTGTGAAGQVEPATGEICVSPPALPRGRQLVALVAQDTYLFNTTLRENVRFFETVVEAQVAGFRACKRCGAAATAQGGTLERGVAFLQKPFAPSALVEKVREVLDAVVPAR